MSALFNSAPNLRGVLHDILSIRSPALELSRPYKAQGRVEPYHRTAITRLAAQASPRGSAASAPRRPPPPDRPSKPRQGSVNNKPRKVQSDTSVRLNKALASLGVASRRGADELIFAGRVSVNGSPVNEPGVQIDLARDTVSVDSRKLSTAAATNKYYFAVNKPKGYICANRGDGSGGSGDRLVVDLFGEWQRSWKEKHPGSGATPRLFTVGRLDVATVGLIFVTNDGDWAQKVQHPSSGLTKEYNITVDRRPGRAELEKLSAGCDIDGVHVTPVAVAVDDTDLSKTARVRMVIAEGRNREVRRLVEAAGMEVRQLRRVRVGGFRLPRELKFGQFVELRPHEVRRVLNIGADRTI